MALATQCPYCQTTFRVAHDQLKLRAGLVRCGACKEIFNGIEHLLRPGEIAPAPLTAQPETSQVVDTLEAPAAEAASIPEAEAVSQFQLPPEAAHELTPQPESQPVSTSIKPGPERFSDSADFYPDFDLSDRPGAPDTTGKPGIEVAPAPVDASSADPLQRMTLMHLTDPDQSPEMTMPDAATDKTLRQVDHAPDELDQAIEYLQRKPWRGKKKSVSREDIEGTAKTDASEPDFVTLSRRRRQSRRGMRLRLGLVAALLLIGAFGQATYIWRDQIAAHLPASKPYLSHACALLGCHIELLAQADAISLESSELTTLDQAKNTFALNVLLRNRSTMPQRWPSIELTLLDGDGQAVVRRIFSGSDYLTSPTDIVKGFGPNAEQPVRIAFELLHQKASDYRVYLFYP